MTNIAVVTNMSVDQLWGQIDQYMSIAQQYGVTTQGVYEVSQIFYQQGLGTSDVMAATTETLKMARIAGMDYKEAADAMTVAIRAFKMEMTDAAHVTDVYSKVASITASDSNELATAMSKTASSAENVGSSFENTTAMLAVMIETTRESAQNLGSALKSIISRYGEMKAGLTKDSEGEEIDFNKVDTALKSVGISIKDAQGQFRDFDDVIFELSEKWDSLDKNTQRYIATIMAGNRQQSRFIALVDNWERLDEISNVANNEADDAGLLQYSKTLDSLDAKINNLKTSF
jgi:TP901 family phage tail tape measure protein